jgi:hypothetical protein
MAGNVWELTADLFNVNHYKELDVSMAIMNPKGANKSYSPANPNQIEYVMKGVLFYVTNRIVLVLEFLQKWVFLKIQDQTTWALEPLQLKK